MRKSSLSLSESGGMYTGVIDETSRRVACVFPTCFARAHLAVNHTNRGGDHP